jgi:hypothetical protein
MEHMRLEPHVDRPSCFNNQQKPYGSGRSGSGKHVMQPQSRSKPVRVLPRPVACKSEENDRTPQWRPHQVGLTRQEMRDIVIDLIG